MLCKLWWSLFIGPRITQGKHLYSHSGTSMADLNNVEVCLFVWWDQTGAVCPHGCCFCLMKEGSWTHFGFRLRKLWVWVHGVMKTKDYLDILKDNVKKSVCLCIAFSTSQRPEAHIQVGPKLFQGHWKQARAVTFLMPRSQAYGESMVEAHSIGPCSKTS